MALTPEDVVNKRFQSTKFREGYDQDEVDDFLDEVVVELRRLNQENEELRQRLVASDTRINELQRGGRGGDSRSTRSPSPRRPRRARTGVRRRRASTPPSMDPGNTNNLLQLARRLHEEHVREGVEKRDALIAEGHASRGPRRRRGREPAARAAQLARPGAPVARGPHRGTAHLRARVPPEAQELHRGPVARPRRHARARRERRRASPRRRSPVERPQQQYAAAGGRAAAAVRPSQPPRSSTSSRQHAQQYIQPADAQPPVDYPGFRGN